MRRLFTLALALVFLSVPTWVGASTKIAEPAAQADREIEAKAEAVGVGVEDDDILAFNSMMPISGAFVGGDLLGVPGAGAAWVLDSANGSLDASGNLELTVTGLVLMDSGMNPLESFYGLVSCAGADGTMSSVSTGAFPADMDGNADIKEMVMLPSPCAAPTVFVTNVDGNWLAVTGAAGAAKTVPEEPLVPEEVEEPAEPEAAMAELG